MPISLGSSYLLDLFLQFDINGKNLQPDYTVSEMISISQIAIQEQQQRRVARTFMYVLQLIRSARISSVYIDILCGAKRLTSIFL